MSSNICVKDLQERSQAKLVNQSNQTQKDDEFNKKIYQDQVIMYTPIKPAVTVIRP